MILVTRHPALVEWFGIHHPELFFTEILSHASEEDVRDQDVVGVLPMRLASCCGTFTELSLEVPAHLRGKELSVQDIDSCNPTLTQYRVIKLD